MLKVAAGRSAPRALGSFLEVLTTHTAPMTPPSLRRRGKDASVPFHRLDFYGKLVYISQGVTLGCHLIKNITPSATKAIARRLPL